MTKKQRPSKEALDDLWSRHHATWRDPAQVVSQWEEATNVDPKLLHYIVEGDWWEVLAKAGITLLITREYEHLVMAVQAQEQQPPISYMSLPHPSGVAVDRDRGVVHIASTRNPNQVYDLAPVTHMMARLDVKSVSLAGQPLIPIRSRFLPGCLYMHDLAMIGATLYANAVGQNAIVRLDSNQGYQRVWWPRSIETETGPIFGQNHLQLNSIAAGEDINSSFFSASTAKPSFRRPGHQNFRVDKQGVIFSGQTREPIAFGLTRPHSARLYQDQIWVDNSGYGEVGLIKNNQFEVIAALPGWTRGLCFYQKIAFVGTSRVIPRFQHYAPGLEVDDSLCGVHAVDIESGQILGSLLWPYGNQIFAIEWVSKKLTSGFPFAVGTKRATVREKVLFYAYETNNK